ncbi:MAG: hypothetical protein COA42_09890 [Alteromonadaceae bacterium]|nr:MAG: hypothetical protein COA42_09890 [Alteromonadaceae bacterium]
MPLFNHSTLSYAAQHLAQVRYLAQLMAQRVLLAVLLISTGFAYAEPNKNNRAGSSNVIRMNSSDWSPLIKRYQREVIKLLLDNTRAEYGNYRLIDGNRGLPPERMRQSVGLGADTHLGLLSINLLNDTNTDKNTPAPATKIQVPILNGILGLRKLIIRSSDQERFKQIRSKKDFLAFTPGQGLSWPDIDVYKHANINVVTSLTYSHLTPMLQQGRFDYLPLSIIETDAAISGVKRSRPKITSANLHYIMYNAPVYMYVSNDHPILVKRIKKAINNVIASGELEALFLARFSQFIDQISPDSAYVWVLDNPMVSVEENRILTERNLKIYFNEKSTVIR